MSNQIPHPAELYEADMQQVQRRGLFAMIALAVTLGSRLFSGGVAWWQITLLRQVNSEVPPALERAELSDTLMRVGGITQLVMLVVTAVLFLRWLRQCVRLTIALGGTTLRWTPSEAVWAFFIPFFSFLRPYLVIRDVHARLAPDLVPEPPTQVVADGTTGYRDVKLVAPPPPMKLPHAGIGAWWATWWIANALSNVAIRIKGTDVDTLIGHNSLLLASDVADVASALLALLVVRALTARLQERFRRIRHTPAEQLAALHITIL